MQVFVVVCGCFFFQAEDGIRDLVRSRGLGDVYKRQMLASDPRRPRSHQVRSDDAREPRRKRREDHRQEPVSYTHLTLPTSDLV